MKKGERVYRVVCEYDCECHECGATIFAGQSLLIDKIPYVGGVHNHLMHPWHWKGNPKRVIDLTRKRRRGRSYEESRGKNF